LLGKMGSQSVNEMMKFMKDSFYTCTEEWLFACVEWIKENYASNQLTSAFLKKRAARAMVGCKSHGYGE